jgi:GDPmannose 4,6-dehydratase
MAKRALITGITGQDGSYLAKLLLRKGYEVHGIVRRVAVEDPNFRFWRIKHFKDKINLHPGDIQSYSRIIEIFDEVKPQECYHLAAQSFVQESFLDEHSIYEINIKGTLHVLSAYKKRAPDCRFYFAASSEMFGKVEEVPQNEKTKFHPRSPYGISKVTGFEMTRNARETEKIFACSGILFNHESPRRGLEFVTRKIINAATRIKSGEKFKLELGNIDAKRDWGYAGDYVEAMWLMLQQKEPDDFVIATGETHSVKEFVEEAFGYVDLDWQKYVVSNVGTHLRLAEVDLLIGDASKARKKLGWRPKVKFKELVRMMVDSDLKKLG